MALVLSGLPQLNKRLGVTRPQTERLFRGLVVDRLDDRASTEAFTGPLRGMSIGCNRDVLDAIIPEMAGYPHFIQLYGAELWSAAKAQGRKRFTLSLLRATLPTILERIEADMYDFRMSQLNADQRDLLVLASKTSGPPLTADGLAAAGVARDLAVRELGELEELGILTDPADRGEYSYTVPGFHAYLIRRGDRWASTATNVGLSPT